MTLAQGKEYDPAKSSDTIIAALRRQGAKCDTLWRLIQTEVMESSQRREKIKDITGKWVSTGTNAIVYVNDYGYASAITGRERPRSTRCPTEIMPYKEEQEKYVLPCTDCQLLNIDGSMTPCGVAGRNVINSGTGQVAWVDVQGVKHVYSEEVWAEKSSGCAIVPVELTSAEWGALPTGGPMKKASPCLQIDVDPKLMASYKKAQAKLASLAEKGMALADELEQKDQKLNAMVLAAKKASEQQAAEQAAVIDEVNKFKIKRQSLVGELSSSELALKSSHLNMMVWVFVSMATIGIAIAAMTHGPSRLGDFVLVTLALVAVYWVASRISFYMHGY